ncbi:MAG TPA: DUF1307 domain-containing protein [Candidatus Avamphibacillus intestinigallinarum]|nr:DUF1307 domain-containing protein [Candidatus Avamphibacillus intestinigallinarum]
MKKLLSVLTLGILISIVLTACGEKTETFENKAEGMNVEMDVTYKDDIVTHIEQVSTVNYEEARLDKDTLKKVMDKQLESVKKIEAVDVDSKYGDEELVQTIKFDVKDADSEEIEDVFNINPDEEKPSFEKFKEELKDQGFKEKE